MNQRYLKIKTCNKCGRVKDHKEFDRIRTGGTHDVCLVCMNVKPDLDLPPNPRERDRWSPF